MKKIISLTFLLLLALSTVPAFAYYPYYYTNSAPASYTYTQGCYTYYYNGYTQASTMTSYNCQPAYTAPSYNYVSPNYYTNMYSRTNSTWYPQYNYTYNSNSNGYQGTYYNTGYNYGNNYSGNYGNYNNTYSPSSYCSYVNGYQVCQ